MLKLNRRSEFGLATLGSLGLLLTSSMVLAGGDKGGEAGGQSAGYSSDQSMSQLSSEQIRSAQQKLKQDGYEVGPIDGVMGAKTSQALKQFQQENNKPVTGTLDSSTLSALGMDSAGKAGMAAEDQMSGSDDADEESDESSE